MCVKHQQPEHVRVEAKTLRITGVFLKDDVCIGNLCANMEFIGASHETEERLLWADFSSLSSSIPAWARVVERAASVRQDRVLMLKTQFPGLLTCEIRFVPRYISLPTRTHANYFRNVQIAVNIEATFRFCACVNMVRHGRSRSAPCAASIVSDAFVCDACLHVFVYYVFRHTVSCKHTHTRSPLDPSTSMASWAWPCLE